MSVLCRKGLLHPDLQPVQNPDNSIVSIMQKRLPGPWLTHCSQPRQFHCQHHAEKYPGPWLTHCSKPRQFHCQHHLEKAFWTMTYILFKVQTISLSASSTKGLLDPDLHPVQNPDNSIVSIMQKRSPGPNLHAVQNPDNVIVSIMQKRPPRPWLTSCSRPKQLHGQHHAEMISWPWLTRCSKHRQFHCQHHVEKASWTLTYILFKIQTIPLSASCKQSHLDPDLHPVQNPDNSIISIMQKTLLDSDLHTVQNPDNSIVSIMQKRPPGPWLTFCSKPRQFHHQHHAEKVSWTLTYTLCKAQTIPLSASSRKSLLDTDLHAVQNPDNSILSIMQKRPPGPWLTVCSKPRQFQCQHYAEKTSWTLTYILFKTQTIPLSASYRRPGPWLTYCSKPRQFHCQHHVEKASWTLTYILIKIQTIPLSVSCRNGLLDPDLHSVQNPDNCIVSIMQKSPSGPWLTSYSKPRQFHCQHHAKRPPGPWLTSCSKPRQIHCQHHAEQALWTLTYILFKTQTIPLSASCKIGLLDPDLHPVQNPKQFHCQHHAEMITWPWLTSCSKPQQFHCQPNAEKISSPWLTCCSKPRQFHYQHHVVQNPTSTYNVFKVCQYILDCNQMLLHVFWPLPFNIKHDSDMTDQHYISPYDVETNNLFSPHSIDIDKLFCWTERNSCKMVSSERTAAVSLTSRLQSLVISCISVIYCQFTAFVNSEFFTSKIYVCLRRIFSCIQHMAKTFEKVVDWFFSSFPLSIFNTHPSFN